jgi:hypothetical protein
MLGNVAEWVEDCYIAYGKTALTDGGALSLEYCGTRVVRGGSWDSNPRSVRAAYRGGFGPRTALDVIGFRVVRTAAPQRGARPCPDNLFGCAPKPNPPNPYDNFGFAPNHFENPLENIPDTAKPPPPAVNLLAF